MPKCQACPRAGDWVWITGRLAEPKTRGDMSFIPDAAPDSVVGIACSYPGEDYFGVDPLGIHKGGEKCMLHCEVLRVSDEIASLAAWDDNAPDGSGRLWLPLAGFLETLAADPYGN